MVQSEFLNFIGEFTVFDEKTVKLLKKKLAQKFGPFTFIFKEALESVEDENTKGEITEEELEEALKIIEIKLNPVELEGILFIMEIEGGECSKEGKWKYSPILDILDNSEYKGSIGELGDMNIEADKEVESIHQRKGEDHDTGIDEVAVVEKYEVGGDTEEKPLQKEELGARPTTSGGGKGRRIQEDPDPLDDDPDPVDPADPEIRTLNGDSGEERSPSDNIYEGEAFEEGDEDLDLNEDQMIEMAQKCFLEISKAMRAKQTTMSAIYKSAAFKQNVEGEIIDLITPMDFVNRLRELDIPDFETIEYACLIKVLSINDEDQYIRLGDLIQIMEDYGLFEAEEDDEKLLIEDKALGTGIGTGTGTGTGIEEKEEGLELAKDSQDLHDRKSKGATKLDFTTLDEVSMILMLALTDYLFKTTIRLYDLFGEVYYKQLIKTKNKTKTVDLINSTDFFHILCKIGIKTESTEHQNLKQFLALDPNYEDRIYIKKLKKTIEEFATNQELRLFAHKCYDKMLNEDGEEEGEGEIESGVEEEIGEPVGKLKTIEEEKKRENEGIYIYIYIY